MPAGAARVPGAWVGTCPAGHQSSRHRRPERVVTCGQCSHRFDLAHLLEWTHRSRPAPMPPAYLAQLAALRSQQQRAARDAAGAPLGAGAPSLRRGDLVRVTAQGSYLGAVGRVEKRARTRYHVRIPEGLLTVPFALVQPVEHPEHPEHPADS